MSGRLVERIRIESFSASIQAGVVTTVSGQEQRSSRIFEDGSWRQETLPCEGRALRPSTHFTSAWRLWRRFVEEMGINHFELSCTHRTIRRLGQCMVGTLPEWTIFVEAPRKGQSPFLFSRSIQAHKLPSRALMDRVRAITRLPAVMEATFADQPVFVAGDLLLDWLGSAMEHLPSRPANNGHWFFRIGSGGWIPLNNGADQDSQAALPTAAPQTFSFVPTRICSEPRGIFKAVCYDAASGSLTCRRGNTWRIFVVDQPLYRLFGKAQFTSDRHDLVIKGQRFLIPSAILFSVS